MFSFFKKREKDKVVAVVVMESGSVTLTVVSLAGKDTLQSPGRILFFTRHNLPMNEGESMDDMLRHSSSMIDEAFKDLQKSKAFNLVSSAKALVLLGSPWNLSWSQNIKIKRDKPFRLTKETIRKSVHDNFDPTHPDMEIISSHVMSISVNGYKIKNPFDKATPEASFDVYVESAPSVVLQKIKQSVDKHLPHSDVRFTTLGYASAEAMIDYAKVNGDYKSFILILPEECIVDVIVIQDGKVESIGSIPLGSLAIARKLFGSNLSAKEALDKSKRFISGELDENTVSSIAENYEKIKAEFGASFRDLLWSMKKGLLCPQNVFIGGRNHGAYFINEWVSKEDYGSRSFTSDCFKTQIISGSNFELNSNFLKQDLPFVCAVSAHAATVVQKSFDIEAN
jgi:hypothetical protein